MRARWLGNVTAYSLAGAATSALVGAALGFAGQVLLPAGAIVPWVTAAGVVGLLAVARTLGVTAIPFPQPTRQTNDVWAKRMSPTAAAIAWGLDLGLVFTTRLTFPGTWFLAVVAFVGRAPGVGAALLTAYWVGRALSVWIGPSLMRDARETPELFEAVRDQLPSIQKTHVAALAMGVTALIAVAAAGGPWPV
jgi:hypothetical protein